MDNALYGVGEPLPGGLFTKFAVALLCVKNTTCFIFHAISAHLQASLGRVMHSTESFRVRFFSASLYFFRKRYFFLFCVHLSLPLVRRTTTNKKHFQDFYFEVNEMQACGVSITNAQSSVCAILNFVFALMHLKQIFERLHFVMEFGYLVKVK